MLNFTYTFSSDLEGYNYDEFEYEADPIEAHDYILRTHSLDEILTDYINYCYEDQSEESKQELLDKYGIDGTYDSIEISDEDLKFQIADELLFEMVSFYDIYDDELKDYFEQEAYDVYEG